MRENIFTLQETAVILRKNMKSVRYLFKTKRLEYFIYNGKFRVSESALDKFFLFVGKPCLKTQMAANS